MNNVLDGASSALDDALLRECFTAEGARDVQLDRSLMRDIANRIVYLHELKRDANVIAPRVMFRCHCGATMPLLDYDLHGCACGRRPVPKLALDFIDGPVRVQPARVDCEASREVVTNETIADRVWRAHKGFMR